ncbi:MAG: DUF5723 family protein [Bacteroidota bacterium]
MLLLLPVVVQLKGQNITTLGISNYGRVHSLHLNPSFSAYSAYNWQVNLAGVWGNVNNNYLTLRLPYSAYRLPGNVPVFYQTESGNAKFDKKWLQEKLNGNSKHISVASDIYGPSVSVKIKDWSIGFVSSAHANVRASRLPENLAHAIYKEFDSTQGAFSLFNSLSQGGKNTIDRFAVVGNSRIAAGINVAKTIDLEWNRQLLLGASIKRNWGMPGFFLYNSGMELTTISTDSVVLQPATLQMVTYGNSVGKGWGVDLGATYVFHKKATKRQGGYSKHQTKYFGKFGLSIMDIGAINYSDAEFHDVKITAPIGISVDAAYRNSVAGNTNYETLADSFLNKFTSVRNYTGEYKVGLPTRLVISADFQLRKNLFVSGVITQSLRKKLSNNSRYQSAIMVAPRWEYRFFELSVPVMLQYDYRALRVGTSVRLGPLYFGSNSIASFLYTRGVKDADVFIGIAFSDLSDFSFRKSFNKWKDEKARSMQGCYNVF